MGTKLDKVLLESQRKISESVNDIDIAKQTWLIFLKVLALGSRSSTEVRWFVTKSEQVKYVLVELQRSSLKGPVCESPYQIFQTFGSILVIWGLFWPLLVNLGPKLKIVYIVRNDIDVLKVTSETISIRFLLVLQ